ncbi:MAG: hypothetical protein ACRCVG_06005 [Methanobacteriaceae archaeon]
MDSQKGSKIAKNGFKNEVYVAEKFNTWETDGDAQEWLNIMGYGLDEIEYVNAEIVRGYKTDIQVHITIKLIKLVDTQNIQVKLVSNKKGFNQIDKRWVDKYSEIWSIPGDIKKLLKHFTGELEPYKANTKDERRMFLTEFTINEQGRIVEFFEKNKIMILCDIIKGRGKFAAEWMLVIQKIEKIKWALVPINVVINYYGQGNISITPKGSLKIGEVTMQRKGGDGGREISKMLQFKSDPTKLFEI